VFIAFAAFRGYDRGNSKGQVRIILGEALPVMRSFCFLAALLLTGSYCLAAPQYVVTDLGTLGGTLNYSSFAFGVNTAGQVVGRSYDNTQSQSHAFLYNGGTMTDLGTLGGTSSSATGINSAGQVVGYSDTTSGNQPHAFLYSNGILTNLGTLGGSMSHAYAINDSGIIVGDSYGPSGSHAFYYDGSMHDLGTVGGQVGLSTAYGINALGQIVGESTVGNSGPNGTNLHAFLYSAGIMTDLGNLGAYGTDKTSSGRGINTAGQVTGQSFAVPANAQHPFLYSGGLMTDLSPGGWYYSLGTGINSSGQVVGDYYDFVTGSHGFLNTPGVGEVDLNTLLPAGSPIQSVLRAEAISEDGKIVGAGWNGTATHAFLMVPVPEPTTGVLLAIGGMFALRIKRTKNRELIGR
jgi:probable HAF family extracellular repeat protein